MMHVLHIVMLPACGENNCPYGQHLHALFDTPHLIIPISCEAGMQVSSTQEISHWHAVSHAQSYVPDYTRDSLAHYYVRSLSSIVRARSMLITEHYPLLSVCPLPSCWYNSPCLFSRSLSVNKGNSP